MTEKASNNSKTSKSVLPIVKPKICRITKVIRQSTPPGTLRLAYCAECGGFYYGLEVNHRAAFHGEPDEGNPNSP